VPGPGDEHLRAREQQPAIPPLEPRLHAAEVAAGVRLGGSEDRERPAGRQAGQVTGLLLRRAEGGQGRDRPDRRVDRERAGSGRHIGGHRGDCPGHVEHRTTAAPECCRHGQAPEPGLAEDRLGRGGELPPRWRRRVVDRGLRAVPLARLFVEPPLLTEVADLGGRPLEHRLDRRAQRRRRPLSGICETAGASRPDGRHDFIADPPPGLTAV
jgi:hypothetical protein